jgi:hypothetical protein
VADGFLCRLPRSSALLSQLPTGPIRPEFRLPLRPSRVPPPPPKSPGGSVVSGGGVDQPVRPWERGLERMMLKIQFQRAHVRVLAHALIRWSQEVQLMKARAEAVEIGAGVDACAEEFRAFLEAEIKKIKPVVSLKRLASGAS